MAYNIKGEYVVTCSCQLICPCGVDGTPTGPGNECRGAQVLHIAEGTKDGIDLSGIDVGWVYHLPGNVTGGNWTMVLVFDPDVSADRVEALEQIFQGRDGGPFADFAPLITNVLPTERAPVTFVGGKEAHGTIGSGSFGFSPILTPDGKPTTIRNAPLGFAPEYEVGHGSGAIDAAGISFEAVYGEHAQFEFAS